MMAVKKVLMLSVGTGDLNEPEKTLLQPLRKSIRHEPVDLIILVPSQITQQRAAELKTELKDLPIRVQPLPAKGDEDNPDRAYTHFDGLLNKLLLEGYTPDAIEVDFTRGTKAMSAALVLAATAVGVPRLRYITGQRDQRGMVQAGTEKIQEMDIRNVQASRRISDSLKLAQHGNFAGALELLGKVEGPWAALQHPRVLETARQVGPWLQFYAAWDRLAYEAAAAVAPKIAELGEPELAAGWVPLKPSPDQLEWVRKLAKPPHQPDKEPRNNGAEWASYLYRLAADLLANAERRKLQLQLEDALVRCYRVLELVGQIGLFEKGFDSEYLDLQNEKVKNFNKLMKDKSATLDKNRDTNYFCASREQSARFLNFMGDPLGKKLMDIGEKGFKRRNVSILIHGYRAVTGEAWPGDHLFKELETLLKESMPEPETLKDYLIIARSLDFEEWPR